MKKIIDVSVVIPCFNCEATISRAIDSILNQTNLPSEVILVNDCSDDNTKVILDDLKLPEDVRLIVIHLETNKGPAYARNIGIDSCRNRLISFLDADDSWHPRKLEIQYDVMQSNLDVILSGHLTRLRLNDFEKGELDAWRVRSISFRRLLFKNYFNTPSVMIRKSNLRFPEDIRYAEDYFFWLSMANEGGRILFIDAALGFVHKPFYGYSGLSQSLKVMHFHEVKVLKHYSKNKHLSRGFVELAILFARFKYLVRLLRSSKLRIIGR